MPRPPLPDLLAESTVRPPWGTKGPQDGSGETRDRAATDISGNDQRSTEAQQLQAQLVQDPEAMKSILSLQSDPQIQALLNDPQIMQAIARGDYASLLANPKIQALDNDPQLKKVLRDLEQ